MSSDEDHPHEMLSDAKARAERLVRELELAQADAEANLPADISAEQLAQGRLAMQNAIASARRALAALNDAMRIAQNERN